MVTVVDNGIRTDRTKAQGLGIKPKKVPPKPGPVMDEITVNGEVIAEEEIRQEAQHHTANSPGEALRAAAEALVVRELLLQEARRLNIKPEHRNRGDGKLESLDEASIRQLLDQEVAVPDASEEECKRYYDNNLQRFCSGTINEASHILLAVDPQDGSARDAARSVTESLISRLDSDPDIFADLAGEFSDCPSAKQGGNLGQITKGSTVPEFERALSALKDGELRRTPLETRYGFHVVRLDRRIEGRLLPFELVRERIAVWLESASWQRAMSQYVSILMDNSEITGMDFG